MPFKFLPAADNWEKALAGVKVKPDSALSKALEESFKVDSDQPAKRLAMLPKIQKLAADFKKSKEVVAAGPNAVKLVQELIDVVPVVRRDLETNIKQFQRNSACSIDVQFHLTDWNGKSFEYADAYAVFESPGVPKVTKGGKLSGHGLSLDDVQLRPEGSVSLSVYTASRSVEGSCDYEFKPGQKLMRFEGVQLAKTHKTKAKTGNEAISKSGLKGSVGVEFKFISAGGEKTSESESKLAFEDEVEFEIETGQPTFKPFKQTK